MSRIYVDALVDRQTQVQVPISELVANRQAILERPAVFSDVEELPSEGPEYALVSGRGVYRRQGGSWIPEGSVSPSAHPRAQQWFLAHLDMGLLPPKYESVEAVSTFHNTLEREGLSDLVDVFYLLAGFPGAQEESIRLNLMDPGRYTLTPSSEEGPEWFPGIGTSGHGEHSFNTGFFPASEGVFSRTSAHLGVVAMTGETTSGNINGDIGASNSVRIYLATTRSVPNSGGYRLNSPGNRFYTYPDNASPIGLHLVSRTAEDDMGGSMDGWSFSNTPVATNEVVSGSIVIHRAGSYHSPRTLSAVFCGGGLDESQIRSLSVAVRKLLTSAEVFS